MNYAHRLLITTRRRDRRLLLFLLLALILGIMAVLNLSLVTAWPVTDNVQTFVTIFLGIFIEAAPFLLAGSLLSGFLEVFVDREALARWVPNRPLPAAVMGGLLGIAFPVCECGVVPVTRRLYQKGLPLSVGIAFLLAAPVVNPIVIASTYAAFGFGPMLLGRLGLSFLIASTIGFIFHLARPGDVLRPEMVAEREAHHDHLPTTPASRGERAIDALVLAGDDFVDMGRFLVFGSMLAAGMQTLVPQSALLSVGAGPLSSVAVMLTLAFVLSVCSTVDAFLALAFANTFTSASILGFLVFGPMVDIKSSLMFLGVFRRRTVAYLILLPLMLNLLVAVYLNLNVGW